MRFELHQAPLAEQQIQAIADLCQRVFSDPVNDLAWRLARMPELTLASANAGEQLVGFKIGYAHSRTRYYSWLGAVHPDWRRQGIAERLSGMQHAWARAAGFTSVETATDQDNQAMLMANLQWGFVICGVKQQPARTQISLTKSLSD